MKALAGLVVGGFIGVAVSSALIAASGLDPAPIHDGIRAGGTEAIVDFGVLAANGIDATGAVIGTGIESAKTNLGPAVNGLIPTPTTVPVLVEPLP